MKQILIVEENITKIQSALDNENGKSKTHTFSSAYEIIELAESAEEKIYSLINNRKMMSGAIVHERSGESLSGSYNFLRNCTKVELIRRSAGWYLTKVEAVTAYRHALNRKIILSKAQDEKIVSTIRSNYSVSL